jgi:hypothetical protein
MRLQPARVDDVALHYIFLEADDVCLRVLDIKSKKVSHGVFDSAH